MRFRPATLLSAISIALLFYIVLGAMAIQSFMNATYQLRRYPSPPLYANRTIYIGGQAIPLSIAIPVASLWPTYCVLSIILNRARRRNRERRHQCLECGFPLAFRRGRCPKCGVRYEMTGPHQSRFEVIAFDNRPHRARL